MLSLSRHLRAICQQQPIHHLSADKVYIANHLKLNPGHDAATSCSFYSTVSGEDAKPRITLPQRMLRRMDRVHTKQLLQNSRTGAASTQSRGPVVIACKRSQFNHRMGHVYKELNVEHLASKGWKHIKSKGDYFTINATQNNPSFTAEVDPARSRVRQASDRQPPREVHTEGTTEQWSEGGGARGMKNEKQEEQEGQSFRGLGLDRQLSDGLGRLNIHTPTIVQLKTIALLTAGRNLLCTAETGSGKTLAYLLPLVDKINKYNELYGACQAPNRPYGLVLVPSRELARQIHSVSCELAQIRPFNVDVKCGGNNTQRLLREPERAPVDLLVTTPGVFSKLLTNKLYDLSRLSFVVVDEADSLLDDSFSGLTLRILQKLKVASEVPVTIMGGSEDVHIGGTQIVFVGATLPRGLVDILGDIVPMDSIETVSTSQLHRVMPHVAQKFRRLGSSEKPVQLLTHLKSTSSRRIPTLVFCNNSSTACYLGYFLDSNNMNNIVLHSRMPHAVREGRYEKFKNGETDILICTDIASRGLDTIRARHVINYEFPLFMSDYVHRVGRVGRVGSDGSCFALTFVTYKWDVDLLWKIETAIRKKTELHNVNANIKRKLDHRLDASQQSNSL